MTSMQNGEYRRKPPNEYRFTVRSPKSAKSFDLSVCAEYNSKLKTNI